MTERFAESQEVESLYSIEYERTEHNEQSTWQQRLASIREEVYGIIQSGATVSKMTALVAIAGLMSWCPRCGEWQGEGSEGTGQGAPSVGLPPPPAQRLIKAISTPMHEPPERPTVHPDTATYKLTRNSGVLEGDVDYDNKDAKYRGNPPSRAHGRKVEFLYDGVPKHDDRPHAHHADFYRGDGHVEPLYHREKAQPPTFDNGVKVDFDSDTNEYTWTLKERKDG